MDAKNSAVLKFERRQRNQSRTVCDVDDNVDIAVGTFFTARDAAKDTYIRRAVSRGAVQQTFTILPKAVSEPSVGKSRSNSESAIERDDEMMPGRLDKAPKGRQGRFALI